MRDKMSGLNFSAWIRFAEEDLHSAKVLLKEEIYNQVCFHSQQAAEKILKVHLHPWKKDKIQPKIHQGVDKWEKMWYS